MHDKSILRLGFAHRFEERCKKIVGHLSHDLQLNLEILKSAIPGADLAPSGGKMYRVHDILEKFAEIEELLVIDSKSAHRKSLF